MPSAPASHTDYLNPLSSSIAGCFCRHCLKAVQLRFSALPAWLSATCKTSQWKKFAIKSRSKLVVGQLHLASEWVSQSIIGFFSTCYTRAAAAYCCLFVRWLSIDPTVAAVRWTNRLLLLRGSPQLAVNWIIFRCDPGQSEFRHNNGTFKWEVQEAAGLESFFFIIVQIDSIGHSKEFIFIVCTYVGRFKNSVYERRIRQKKKMAWE